MKAASASLLLGVGSGNDFLRQTVSILPISDCLAPQAEPFSNPGCFWGSLPPAALS